MDNNCTNCEHSVFDELWGEHKCMVYQHRIYNLEKVEKCPKFKIKSDKK